LRVLIVEDSENDARLIHRQLTTAGYEVVLRRVETEAELRAALTDDSWQLVLCDYHLPRLNAIRALEIIQATGLDLPVVVVSGQIGEEAAVDLMRRGAHDYLLKDKMARFIPVVQRELQEAEERSRHRQSEFDRSRAERALRESEARYRSVVSALAEGIVLIDRSGLIVACNDSAAHIIGIPKEQLLVSSLDQSLWRLYQEDGTPIPEADRPLRVCLNTGRALDDMVMGMQRADGTRLWISAHVRPCLHDASGLPALVAMSFSDITAQRAAEARIREQARLIDLARDAIVAYDLDGTIRFWNQGAERMYGWNAAAAVGQNVLKLFAPMFPPEWEKFCQTVVEKNAWEGERRHRNKEGREIIVYTRVSLVRDTAQRPPAFLMFGSDITEKKQLEEQFLRAQRLESIGTLSSGVAHDLNNVLSPIMLAIPIVRMRVADPQTLHLLDTMETSASRGAQIVQQILTFTRGLHAQKMTIQTRHLLKEIAEMVQETFPRNIAIKADFPRALWLVEADTTQLHQVLMNLCINARDAMPQGGTLTLHAENIELTAAAAAPLAEARPGVTSCGRSSIPAWVFRPRICRGCSSRFSPPRPPARVPASACPPWPTSCASTKDSSASPAAWARAPGSISISPRSKPPRKPPRPPRSRSRGGTGKTCSSSTTNSRCGIFARASSPPTIIACSPPTAASRRWRSSASIWPRSNWSSPICSCPA
jgi:PAS domain S-box-containing protein